MSKSRKQSSGFSTSNEKRKKDKTLKATLKKENKAIKLISEGELISAELIYRELISEGSKNYIVYSNLGVLCGIKGENKEMIRLLMEAIKIKPDSSELQNNLGNAYKGIGDLDSATICYNKALLLNASYPEAYNNLGSTYDQKDDFKRAIQCYKKAIELKPDYPEALNNLGIIYQKTKDYESSIRFLEEAILIKQNFPEAYFNLGVAYQEKGNAKKAFIFSEIIAFSYPLVKSLL